MPSLRLKWILLLALLPVASLTAQEEPLAPAEHMKISKLSLFKNGYGFIERNQTIYSGQEFRAQLPSSTLGTFWLVLPNGKDCSFKARTEKVSVSTPYTPTNIKATLLASDGQKLKIWLSQKEIYTGILKVIEDRDPDTGRVLGSMLSLKLEDGELLLFNASSVQRIAFPKGSSPRKARREKLEDQLIIDLESPQKSNKLSIQHLARGISWVPSYVIDISKKEKALVSSKALVINDLEDLFDVELDLTVGYPNIEFATVNNPLQPVQNLDNFLQQLTNLGRANSSFSNDLSNQSMAYNSFSNFSQSQQTMPSKASNEDLYFHDAGRLSLKKGARAYIPLFNLEYKYKHIYEWDIVDYVDSSSRFTNHRQLPVDEVWHSISLLNDSAQPWTTGSAMIMDNGKLLSQDTLHYTNPGTEANVKITKALGVIPTSNEVQDKSEGRETVRYFGSTYELIKVNGFLEVKNTLSKDIHMEVTKHLSGDIIEMEGDPTVEAITEGLRRVNSTRKVLWCPTIKAGETWKVKYSYKVLIWR